MGVCKEPVLRRRTRAHSHCKQRGLLSQIQVIILFCINFESGCCSPEGLLCGVNVDRRENLRRPET